MRSIQRRARDARRLPACLALAALGLACGDATGPLQPADVMGTYALQSVSGHALPWADTSATNSTRSQLIWYGERLTLAADGTALNVATLGDRSHPQPRPDSARYQWALSPDGRVDGFDFVRLRYPRPDGAHGPLHTDFYYRVEAAGRRLVAAGLSTTWTGAYPPDVYTR